MSYTWKRGWSLGTSESPHMPLEDVLATQGDRPHKRRLHTRRNQSGTFLYSVRHARFRAELRVETWQTAHDVANAYLSLKHDVAKQAANELALTRSAHFASSGDHLRRRR